MDDSVTTVVNSALEIANSVVELKEKKAYYQQQVEQIKIDRENAATAAASKNADEWIAYYEDLEAQVDEAISLMEQVEEKDSKRKYFIFGGVAILSIATFFGIYKIMK